jgi:hypothetical protein
MLLLLPAPFVPLCVAAGYALAGTIDHAKGRRHLQRVAVLFGNCWHAFAPALVLAVFAGPEARWADWPIYVAALCAQFAFDFASSAGREWLAFGISPRKLLPFFRWVYTVDALLAPLGLLAAFESRTHEFAFLLVLPPVFLLRLLARERSGRIERAQVFQQAYDGAYVDARRDALTGLANRLAWDEAIARAQGALDETATPASVIVLDVDGLKLANDSRGPRFRRRGPTASRGSRPRLAPRAGRRRTSRGRRDRGSPSQRGGVELCGGADAPASGLCPIRGLRRPPGLGCARPRDRRRGETWSQRRNAKPMLGCTRANRARRGAPFLPGADVG